MMTEEKSKDRIVQDETQARDAYAAQSADAAGKSVRCFEAAVQTRLLGNCVQPPLGRHLQVECGSTVRLAQGEGRSLAR